MADLKLIRETVGKALDGDPSVNWDTTTISQNVCIATSPAPPQVLSDDAEIRAALAELPDLRPAIVDKWERLRVMKETLCVLSRLTGDPARPTSVSDPPCNETTDEAAVDAELAAGAPVIERLTPITRLWR